jgi:hypothetical protein
LPFARIEMGLSDEEDLMEEVSNKEALAVIDAREPEDNGHHRMTATATLPIAKFVTNEQIVAEEKFLAAKEADVEKRYTGLRGYFRILHVSAVIGKLALYLYLDQYDIHKKAQTRHAKERLRKAQRLTRAAVLGEKLFGVRLWFLDLVLRFLRLVVIGGERNKEANQERQAVWLKDKLIELGPTFIKIGQSMGTRADLLPLPFVKALGELQDQVPPFPNEIAFARIEKNSSGRSMTSTPNSSSSRSRWHHSDRFIAHACTAGKRSR